MKKIAITGGGGFVGSAIAKELSCRGFGRIIIIGRNNYPELAAMEGICQMTGDIRDLEFLNRAFKGVDTVFHVAAKAGVWGPWEDYYSINVTGTNNVIKACINNKISSLVYTSTPSVVFKGGNLCGVNEFTPYATDFLCHYAHTKVLAEQEVLKVNGDLLKTIAIRPHLVWGPGDTNLLPRLIERGKKGLLKIVGDGKNMVDISYIDNVVTSHILAAENLNTNCSAAGKTFFISQGQPVNLWNWINGLFRRLKIPEVKKRVSFRKAYLAGMLMEKAYLLFRIKHEPLMTRFVAEQLSHSHWFSIDRARQELGYQAEVSTPEGLNRTVAWVNTLPSPQD
jgi:2-alkyl-3-oxoalkanoate reductase